MSRDLLAVVYGLASAACWGTGDFSGGLASRRANVFSVVLVSELLGVALLAAVATALGRPIPSAAALGWGAAAGVFGTIGLLYLYHGFATGQMGVVAPVSAVVTAAVPVLAGALVEGAPTWLQLAGFCLALAGIWLVSRGGHGPPVKLRALGVPVAAGLGFGVFLIALNQAATAGQADVLWPLVASRTTSLAMMLIVVAAARKRAVPPRATWPVVLVASLMDTGGNFFYSLASQVGRMDVSAVLSSLYPAATVLWAGLVLRERLAGRQWAGVALILGAVVLIAW